VAGYDVRDVDRPFLALRPLEAMPRIAIDDLDDPRLAVYRHLKATNETRGLDLFVVEGLRLVERLAVSRFPLVSALTTDLWEPRVAPRVPVDVPLFVVPQASLSGLVGYHFHQGALGCGRRVEWPSVDELARDAGPRATMVVAPRVDNPENLGALIRLADVFGAAAVVAGPGCPDPLSRRVLRVSMGTALRVPTRIEVGIEGWVETVTDADAVPLHDFDRPDRLAVLFGCEGTGLPPVWVGRCDHRLTIPMREGAESLNLAVAAGIVLYRLTTGAG
jgi:tRNA G18 (ribose-2'-O)-methylase SpoU